MLAGDSRGAWDAHVLDDPRVLSLWDGSRLAGRWFADHSTGPRPTRRHRLGRLPRVRQKLPLAERAERRDRRRQRHHRQHQRTRAALHLAPYAQLKRAAPTADGYDRVYGQAALPAANPFQAADRLPAPPLRANGAQLLARRATRRSRHWRARAAPAAAERRRRRRAPRTAPLDRARPERTSARHLRLAS